MNRERAFALYCEALREGGLLVVVFASLDAWFGKATLGVIVWILSGIALLYAGIRLDPEVRKK